MGQVHIDIYQFRCNGLIEVGSSRGWSGFRKVIRYIIYTVSLGQTLLANQRVSREAFCRTLCNVLLFYGRERKGL